MITYIIKFILSSSLLFIIYYLFLEKEKMYHFNRFYLLFSILFSIVISFITVNIKSATIPFYEPILVNELNLQDTATPVVNRTISDINIVKIILLAFYFSISIFLFYKYLTKISHVGKC
jgi:hypothetical protein